MNCVFVCVFSRHIYMLVDNSYILGGEKFSQKMFARGKNGEYHVFLRAWNDKLIQISLLIGTETSSNLRNETI